MDEVEGRLRALAARGVFAGVEEGRITNST